MVSFAFLFISAAVFISGVNSNCARGGCTHKLGYYVINFFVSVNKLDLIVIYLKDLIIKRPKISNYICTCIGDITEVVPVVNDILCIFSILLFEKSCVIIVL